MALLSAGSSLHACLPQSVSSRSLGQTPESSIPRFLPRLRRPSWPPSHSGSRVNLFPHLPHAAGRTSRGPGRLHTGRFLPPLFPPHSPTDSSNAAARVTLLGCESQSKAFLCPGALVAPHLLPGRASVLSVASRTSPSNTHPLTHSTPPKLPHGSSNPLGTPPPQGLCTGCHLHLGCFSSREPHSFPSYFLRIFTQMRSVP